MIPDEKSSSGMRLQDGWILDTCCMAVSLRKLAVALCMIMDGEIATFWGTTVFMEIMDLLPCFGPFIPLISETSSTAACWVGPRLVAERQHFVGNHVAPLLVP
jgi:hypothetical protein